MTSGKPFVWKGRRGGGWRRGAMLAMVAGIAIATRFCNSVEAPPQGLSAPPLPAGEYRVERVVDGDTLILAIEDPELHTLHGEQVRLRLLGIDAPESVKPNHPVEPWGEQASAYLRRLVEGRLVRLEWDRRRVDQYGRYLGYAYLGEACVNEQLVAAGLARVSHFPGDSVAMERLLNQAEERARESGVGIWSEESPAAQR